MASRRLFIRNRRFWFRPHARSHSPFLGPVSSASSVMWARGVPMAMAVPRARGVPMAMAVPRARGVPASMAVPRARGVPMAMAVPLWKIR